MTSLILVFALAPVWAYLCGSVIVAARFARRRAALPDDRPAISVLKPLYGDELGLYENLLSFVDQDYPVIQIVFGVRSSTDGALPIVRRVIAERPDRDIALVIDSRVSGRNLKVANLANMLPAARHDVLVFADSDMRVGRDYLATVTAPLADPKIGLVTCLYKGWPTGGVWSWLGAQHINFSFLPAALLGEALGTGGGCFGATIVLRRAVLERIGGLAVVRDELADDHRIGAAVREAGFATALSPYLVATSVAEKNLKCLWRHELRWARTVRLMAPVGFAGSIVTHAVPLSLIATLLCGLSSTSLGFLAISCALRWASAGAIARILRLPSAGLWLLPLRDLLSFAVFLGSFCGRNVSWRDQLFRVEPSGVIVDGDGE
ncbi:MAG TPA: bacteriohopanetetrol glucosamine biosynthesis glycosyltransferase HpnI [Stellaceae bacterium]|jgi:ceramide glucosyltransferase|nr:bacteriohopanetetrol glucosamine biosynthesis glycosyltransferase HpnI [Stellaceae bacterium]